MRSDSPSGRRKHGVALYIKMPLKYIVLPSDIANVLAVHLPDFNLFICTLYRPPSYSDQENLALIGYLESLCDSKEIVVLGDFNLPTLSWPDIIDNDPGMLQGVAPLDGMFLDSFLSLGLEQIVREATIFPSGNILDLILCSHSFRIGSCSVLAPLPKCCHCPIVCTYIFQNLTSLPDVNNPVYKYIWPKGRYDLISSRLLDIDWTDELYHLTPNAQYCRLLSILRPLIDRFVPISKSLTKDRVPWTVNPPESLRRERSEA